MLIYPLLKVNTVELSFKIASFLVYSRSASLYSKALNIAAQPYNNAAADKIRYIHTVLTLIYGSSSGIMFIAAAARIDVGEISVGKIDFIN